MWVYGPNFIMCECVGIWGNFVMYVWVSIWDNCIVYERVDIGDNFLCMSVWLQGITS